MPESVDLRPLQLFFLAAAVFVVSAGYGSLLPLLPAWLAQQMPGATPAEVLLFRPSWWATTATFQQVDFSTNRR